MTDHIIARGNGGGHFTPSPKPSTAKQPFSAGPHIPGLDASPALPADEMSALESRAEIDSLGDLHARRRTLLIQLAPLKALHGHNGLYDDKRKQMVEACKVRARLSLTEQQQKATDAAVESMAYADGQYARFIDDGISARIDYINMQNEYDEIMERIRNRELALLAYNSEVKLAR
jgi:hypothetical protein